MRCSLYYIDKETQVPCVENYTIKAISHVYTPHGIEKRS